MSPVDVIVGVTASGIGAAAWVAERTWPVAAPVVRLMLDPPGVPQKLRARRWLDVAGDRGAELRAGARPGAERLLDAFVPVLLEEVLRRAHLTELVVRHVDLDAVVAAVDVDAIVRRLDLTTIVLERVDLDAVVEAVLEQVDLDAVLDRLDLTAVVLERVDLDVLVKAVLARIDLAGLAEDVIEAVDLPGIIRESTGSMASETVRGGRMQGIAADEAIARMRNRILLRRGHAEPADGVPPQPGGTP